MSFKQKISHFFTLTKAVNQNRKLYGFKFAKQDMASMNVGALASTVIIIVIVLVIAISLIPTIFNSTLTVTNNATYKTAYPAALSIVNLIPLVFGAIIIVLALVLGFEKMDK